MQSFHRSFESERRFKVCGSLTHLLDEGTKEAQCYRNEEVRGLHGEGNFALTGEVRRLFVVPHTLGTRWQQEPALEGKIARQVNAWLKNKSPPTIAQSETQEDPETQRHASSQWSPRVLGKSGQLTWAKDAKTTRKGGRKTKETFM